MMLYLKIFDLKDQWTDQKYFTDPNLGGTCGVI